MIRPVKPEDEKYYELFTEKLDPDDIHQRLFEPLRRLPHQFIARLTQIDYARAMAFIAIDLDTDEMPDRPSCRRKHWRIVGAGSGRQHGHAENVPGVRVYDKA